MAAREDVLVNYRFLAIAAEASLPRSSACRSAPHGGADDDTIRKRLKRNYSLLLPNGYWLREAAKQHARRCEKTCWRIIVFLAIAAEASLPRAAARRMAGADAVTIRKRLKRNYSLLLPNGYWLR
jgi:hypothetical protein